MQADVIIVGAGAAGLLAARELSNADIKVLVLEARDRIGGRIHTLTNNVFSQPVETGAEFVHGDLELTLQLLHEAHLQKLSSGGAVWRSRDGKLFQQEDFIEEAGALIKALNQQQEEMSIGAFLENKFPGQQYAGLKKSLKIYVEGYYAGELDRASVLAMKEEWQQEEQHQYRLKGGYVKLMQFLYEHCVLKSAIFQFSSPVKTIAWGFEKVEVTTDNGKQFKAKKIIVTVPTSVLLTPNQAASITFQPQLTHYQHALEKLGYGGVIKILIEFKMAFWSDDFNLKQLSFLFSDEAIPTWWTQHPQQSNLLVGWCAGPNAELLKDKSENELFEITIQSLAHIFNLSAQEVEQKISARTISNWITDPFTLGGYSYVTTTTKEALRLLSQPVENTIYFAGEALYDNFNTGTVEAALQSGKKVAQQVLSSVGQP